MLEFKDQLYFSECVNDQNSLLVQIKIRRCVNVSRKSNYPDAPLENDYIEIPTRADIREVPISEIAHSGGLLLTGDNQIWTQDMIRGPGAGSDVNSAENVADVILLQGFEWVIVGYPFVGRGVDPQIWGYTAYIRRRIGAYNV